MGTTNREQQIQRIWEQQIQRIYMGTTNTTDMGTTNTTDMGTTIPMREIDILYSENDTNGKTSGATALWTDKPTIIPSDTIPDGTHPIKTQSKKRGWQKITNNKCQCGNGESSIEHLLLFCQRYTEIYTEQRKEFMTSMNLIMMINDNNDNTILTIAQPPR